MDQKKTRFGWLFYIGELHAVLRVYAKLIAPSCSQFIINCERTDKSGVAE